MSDRKITDWQLDVVKELLNIGVGKGANILNDMLGAHIALRVPEISVTSYTELKNKMTDSYLHEASVVDIEFAGDIQGTAKMIFPPESAVRLVNILINEKSDFDSIKANTLTEIGNIVLNSITGIIANYFKIRFQYTVPSWHQGFFSKQIEEIDVDSLNIFLARTIFSVQEHDIQGEIALMFKMESFDVFLDLINKIDHQHND